MRTALSALVAIILLGFVGNAKAQDDETQLKSILNEGLHKSDAVVIDAGPAVAHVINQTPSGWNAIILTAGASFRYDSGTDDNIIHSNIDLKSGSRHDIQAPKNNCVIFMRVAAIVKVDTAPPKILYNDTSSKPNECLFEASYVLNTKPSIMAGSGTSKTDLLELQIQR